MLQMFLWGNYKAPCLKKKPAQYISSLYTYTKTVTANILLILFSFCCCVFQTVHTARGGLSDFIFQPGSQFQKFGKAGFEFEIKSQQKIANP